MFGVNAIYTDESLVYKELANTQDRRMPHQSEPGAAQEPTRHQDLNVVLMTKFHRNIDGVCQYGYAFAMAKAARNLGRRSARTDGDGLSVRNDFGSRQADAPFFGRQLLFLFLER